MSPTVKRLAAWGLVLVLGFAACGPRSQDVASGGSGQPSASPSPSPSVAATATPTPSPLSVPFPDLPVIVGTSAGDLYFALSNGQPVGPKVHACSGAISSLVAYGRQAAFVCGGAGVATALFLWDEATNVVTEIAKTERQEIAFDGASIAYLTLGKTEPSAPIAMTKLVLWDMRSGASTTLDERYGVALDLRLIGDGIAVWRPKNSLSFVRPEAEAGTWLVTGTSLTKIAQLRVVDGGKGRYVAESEPIDPATGYSTSSFCCTYVALRTTTEQRLTPPEVKNEKALAMLEDGRVVAWRPDSGEFDGSVVIYSGATVARIDRGPFTSFRVLRSGDWLVGQMAFPNPTIRAYRLSDGAFASVPNGGISALALLGPKK